MLDDHQIPGFAALANQLFGQLEFAKSTLGRSGGLTAETRLRQFSSGLSAWPKRDIQVFKHGLKADQVFEMNEVELVVSDCREKLVGELESNVNQLGCWDGSISKARQADSRRNFF